MTTKGRTGEGKKEWCTKEEEEAVGDWLTESAKRKREEGDKRKKKGDGDGVFLVWSRSETAADSRKSFADVDLMGMGGASSSRVNITPIKAGSSMRTGLFPGAVGGRARLDTPPVTKLDARSEEAETVARKPIGHDQTAEFLRPVVKVNPKKTEEEKAREQEADTERLSKESGSGVGMDQTAQVLSKAGKAGAFSGWGYKLGFLKPVNEQLKHQKKGFCTGPLPTRISHRFPRLARPGARGRFKPLSAGVEFCLLAAAFSSGSPLSCKATVCHPRL